jgi:hypothetical protein
MSYLTHKDKHWPLALTIAQGKLTLNQHLASLEPWDKWFKTGEPFHVIRLYKDAASLEQEVGVGKATQKWMTNGADLHFRTLVKSMLIVVPPEQYPRVEKMSVRKVFGIPGGIFSSIDDALNWLEKPPESLDMLGIRIDKNWKSTVKEALETCAEFH